MTPFLSEPAPHMAQAGAPGTDRALLPLTAREARSVLAWALAIFVGLGTLTALWHNPLFMRMTPVGPVDYALLGGEALLLGLYLGLRGPGCAAKRAGLGGLLGFLGFGCVLCNQVLMYLFGAAFLLAHFEPYRHIVGLAGLAVLALALRARLRRRAALRAGLAGALG